MSQLKKLEGKQNYAADEFNMNFLKKDREIQLAKSESEYESDSESENNSKIYLGIDTNTKMDDLGIDIKNLFFKILETLANGENPIPYIMGSSRNQFVFAIMIIIIGGLMLFLSNLMI
jgi:hypothetical protein